MGGKVAGQARRVAGLVEAALALLPEGEVVVAAPEASTPEASTGSAPSPLGTVVPDWMRDLWAGQAGALVAGRTCLVELPDRRRVRMRLHETPGGGLVWRRDHEAEAAYLAERRAQAKRLGVEWDEVERDEVEWDEGAGR